MYDFEKADFNTAGFIPNDKRNEMCPADQVLAYIKSWDRSHGFKYCIGVGQVRTHLIGSFMRKILGVTVLPELEAQLNTVFENFALFKKTINQHHKSGTLSDFIYKKGFGIVIQYNQQ